MRSPFVLVTALASIVCLAWSAAGPAAPGSSRGPAGPSPARSSPALREVSLDDLAWLAGTWRKTEDGSVLEETWVAPLGDTMMGMLRWLNGDKPSLYELMTIEVDGDGVPVFHIRHFNPGLRPWPSEAGETTVYPLADLGETSFVFENEEAKDARRFVYELDEDGTLHVRVELSKGDPYVFEFERADS